MFRRFLSLILLCAILALLPSQPVSSQAIFTTMTSAQNSTETVTTSIYSTIYSTTTSTGDIHFLQRPDDYNNVTGSFTFGQYEELFRPSPPNRIPAEVEQVCLYYDYFLFTAGASQEIKGHFETSEPIEFYLMTLNQLEFSFYNLLCGNNVGLIIHPAVSVTASSYELDWVAPQTDQYVFLFATHRPFGGYATISFSAYTYSTSVATSTVTNTPSSMSTIQTFETFVSTQTTNMTSNIFQSIFPVAMAVIIALGVGAAIITIMRRRNR